jgi:hypothetical protein
MPRQGGSPKDDPEEAQMYRRTFLQAAAAGIAGSVVIGRKARAQETAAIVWHAPADQVPRIREKLDFNGTVNPDPASPSTARVGPLIVLIGIAGISSLVSALANVYRDVRYGGCVVTPHDGRLEITNDPRLPSGTLIVYDENGIQVHQSTPTTGLDTADLLQKLISLTAKKPRR